MKNKHLMPTFAPIVAALALATPFVAAQGVFGSRTETLTDGQILEVIEALNEVEIDLARLALRRTDDTAVREVAEALIADHRASDREIDLLEDTYRELDTEDSNLSEDLEDDGEALVRSLRNLDDAQFVCTFLQEQEKQHQMALQLINDQLLPAAQSEHVKSFLTASAPKLEHHLHLTQAARAKVTGC